MGGVFLLCYALHQFFFMIKLKLREMRYLSRILTICLCCVSAFHADAVAAVATTAGSDLTSYHPSNAYNNQWATMANVRSDPNSAKADFGNCNSLILRCAQPKCSNGGCTDISLAAAIVKGCVQSNKSCEQYGDDLVNYMSAQLVASSNAKVNAQQAQLAQQQAAQQQQQMAQIQSEMQQQMYQMQQQMYQQQQESAQQLQEALAAQQAQSQQALDSMKIVATESAEQTEAGISSYQQEAIARGISADVLERQKITGQILTEIENAETSLTEVKKAMNTVFDYAGCDSRGNNCTGPKRVKKFRELASDFIDPYDNTIVKLYDALTVAQLVGVDMSQIYMMLNDSCNSWGQYMCEKGANIQYSGKNGAPMSCPDSKYIQEQLDICYAGCRTGEQTVANGDKVYKTYTYDNSCKEDCVSKSGCKPCTLLKVLTSSDSDAIYDGWTNTDVDSTTNGSVIACASGVLDSSKLLSRVTRNKNGAGLVNIDELERWILQTEPNTADKNKDHKKYCDITIIDNGKEILQSSVSSRVVPARNVNLCVDKPGGKQKDETCPYINPVYALCDTHVYNIGKPENIAGSSNTEREEMREIIMLKSTALAQQLYKQYEYLSATLRRFKIQLEKSVLTANLEAAGAKTDSSSSAGGLAGGSRDTDKTIYLPGANNCSNFLDFDSAYNCLQTNVSLIKSSTGSNIKKACQQLQATVASAQSILGKTNFDVTDNKHACKKFADAGAFAKSCAGKSSEVTACADAINFAVMAEKRDQAQKSNRISYIK